MTDEVTLPNAITLGNLVAGFLALVVVQHSLTLATALVLLAALCDWLDGVAARRRSTSSALGANLDSLADMVSFGVVPATAVYLVAAPAPVVGALVAGTPALALLTAAVFVVCGAWRLARFPLVKQACTFVGLPIPVAGVLVMLAVVAGVPAGAVVLLALGLSALMVSTVPFPTVAAVAAGATSVVRPRGGRRLRLRRPRRRGTARGSERHRGPLKRQRRRLRRPARW